MRKPDKRRIEVVLDPAIPEEQDAIARLELLMVRNTVRSPSGAAKMLILDCIVGYCSLTYSDLAKRQQHIAALLLGGDMGAITLMEAQTQPVAPAEAESFELGGFSL